MKFWLKVFVLSMAFAAAGVMMTVVATNGPLSASALGFSMLITALIFWVAVGVVYACEPWLER